MRKITELQPFNLIRRFFSSSDFLKVNTFIKFGINFDWFPNLEFRRLRLLYGKSPSRYAWMCAKKTAETITSFCRRGIFASPFQSSAGFTLFIFIEHKFKL